ncbi:MAG: pyridoxamine 5'-phosphate oxidase family protein [Gammaproteobacteria bacterium]|nr:pyridoxamine 5'-phosphate oxidase family protein [Gammaproteobacteria bacterium]
MNDDNAQVIQECNDLIERCQSLTMSTLDDNKKPSISYAPFVRDQDNAFYIFISDLASHTRHLETQPRTSIMLIEDEQNARQIFARTRVIYECTAQFVARDNNRWSPILEQLQDRFGEIILTLRELSDFKLFHLTPERGTFVKGFGQAYRLEGEHLDKAEHIRRNA